METVELITGFTLLQMIYHFFDRHKEGAYSTLNITDYIYKNFELPEDKTFRKLNKDVSSVLASFYNHKNNKEPNFFRYLDNAFCGKKYLYEYTPNSSVSIPIAFRVEFPATREKIDIAPRQQTYKPTKQTAPKPEQLEICFDAFPLPMDESPLTIKENPVVQELSPLMQDIKNAETIQSTQFQTFFEELDKWLLPNQSLTIKKIEDMTFTVMKTMEA